ncbi:hypothetical protein Fot_38263 [Forsythia ovata]|uniref:Uncharacterized protein n=1 Tax=Forsythia ovata TaxID=205694 RepID=A0ABD1S223_9LAMI
MEAFDEHDQCLNNEEIGVGSDNIDGCYVLTMQCSSEIEVDNDIIDDDFFHQEEISSQLEESLLYNDLPTDVEGQVVGADDTDYGDSDKLRSLSSEDEEETSSKKKSRMNRLEGLLTMDLLGNASDSPKLAYGEDLVIIVQRYEVASSFLMRHGLGIYRPMPS